MGMRTEVIFDEATHTYTAGGVILPSVTQVLPQKDFFVDAERLEECRKEGKINHAIVQQYFSDGDTMGLPLLEGLRRFIAEHPELGAFVGSEVRMASRFRFAGTADMLFKNGVVDLKRSIGDRRIHALQTEGYAILAEEAGIINPTKIRIILTIDDDGGYKAVPVWNELARPVFFSCVKRWWAKDEQQKTAIDDVISKYMRIA